MVILLVLVFGEIPHLKKLDFKIHFLDVGQGDSALIEFPTGEVVLIDGGPDAVVVSKINKILGYFRREIDLVILTHPHADHLAGIINVLKSYDVKQVLYTGAIDNSPEDKIWEKWIADHPGRVWYAKRSDQYKIGTDIISVLYPVRSLLGKSLEANASSANEESIVVMLNHLGYKFLFTGDASVDVEKQLLVLGDDLKADVLKVAHHGSRFSSSDDFIQAVKPGFAIISVGQNKLGHPAVSTISKLKAVGAQIYRTDQNGEIDIGIKDDHLVITKEK